MAADDGNNGSPEYNALVEILEHWTELVTDLCERGEETDPNFTFVNAAEQFGDLPPELVELTQTLGAARANYHGPVTDHLMDLFEAAGRVFHRGITAQCEGCTAHEANGDKCSAKVAGKRNQIFSLCRRHISDSRVFMDWVMDSWRPVKEECCNCTAEEADGDLASMACLNCGRGVHTPCLLRAVEAVQPGLLESSFGDRQSDYFACAHCVTYDYASMLLRSRTALGADPETLVVICPPVVESDSYVEDDWARLQQDKRRALVPNHILVAIEAPSEAAARPAAGKQSGGQHRGGSSFSNSEGVFQVPRPGRRGGASRGVSRASSSSGAVPIPRPGSGAGEARSGRERRGAQQDESARREMVAMLEREGFQRSRRPVQGAMSSPAVCDRPMSTHVLSGEAFGAKSGQHGAFDCVDAHAVEPYHGQGAAQGKVYGSKVTYLIGVASVSVAAPNFGPDSKPQQQGFTLENGQFVAVQAGSLATPLQHAWANYADAAMRIWEQAKTSGLGVFDPAHEHYDYHVMVADLIIMRYRYLLELASKLQQGRQAVSWDVAWRYITLFISEEWAGVTTTDSDLDRWLLDVDELDVHRRSLKVAATVKLDPYRLQVAKDGAVAAGRGAGGVTSRQVTMADLESCVAKLVAAASAANRGGVSDGAGSGGAARQKVGQPADGGKKRCPLCLSTEHVYHAGNYGHKEGMKITQPCTKVMSDGLPCGKKHAFTGPLQTPCRGAEGAGDA